MPGPAAHLSPLRRRRLLQAAASLWPAATLAQLKSGDQPDASPRWLQVKASVFAGRDIANDGDAVLRLDVPARAVDAAVVPLALHAAFAQTPQRHIRRAWLVIDNNPAPLSCQFGFALASGLASLETRVRVDEYTFVRAIAETQDGKLHASTRFVKAAGGCSAPPGKDMAAALATLGQMQLRVLGPATAPGQPVQAQLQVSHPNDSGFVMDQLTRQHVPAHFVRQIDITQGGELLLSAEVDFSLSENPNLRFWLLPRSGAELVATVVDSRERRFSQRLALPALG